MSFRMTTILADIFNDMNDYREFTNFRMPNTTRLTRLFNEAQNELAIDLECIDNDFEELLPGYLSESLTAEDVTTERKIILSLLKLENDTNDYYNGWLLTNTTRKETAWIVDTVVTGSEVTLNLSRAIANQDADDSITIERIAKYVDMHWSLIRPFLGDGVHWDTYTLKASTMTKIEQRYRVSSSTGTPQHYAQQNQRLWLYPQPTNTELVRLKGPVRAIECFSRTVTTSNGESNGASLASTNIPLKADDYYKGAEIEMLDGTCVGEIRRISEYDASAYKLYPETPFSAQIDSGDGFEILSPIPLDLKPAIIEYLKWKIFERQVYIKGGHDFSKNAKMHEGRYLGKKEEYDDILARRHTNFDRIGDNLTGGFQTITILEAD